MGTSLPILPLCQKRLIFYILICKKGILNYFASFTGEHLCRNLFFNKVANLISPARYFSLCVSLISTFRRCSPIFCISYQNFCLENNNLVIGIRTEILSCDMCLPVFLPASMDVCLPVSLPPFGFPLSELPKQGGSIKFDIFATILVSLNIS